MRTENLNGFEIPASPYAIQLATTLANLVLEVPNWGTLTADEVAYAEETINNALARCYQPVVVQIFQANRSFVVRGITVFPPYITALPKRSE